MKTLPTSKMKMVCSLMGTMMFMGMMWSGSVHAEVKTHTYPGTMCQPYNPSAANNVRYTTQGVYNLSTTQSATVKCPVPATLGGKLASVIVDVKDQSDASTITCHVYIRELNGQLVHQESGNSDQFGSGNWDVFMTNISYGGWDGVASIYNLSCSLPKKLSNVAAFSVIAYHVTEVSN